MIIKCGIVESEPLSEKVLRKFIKTISFFEISWSCNFAEEATQLMEREKVDLLFLNVFEIPVKKESPFYHLMENHENIVLLSAYPRKMVNTNLQILGFLNKPFHYERFIEVINYFLSQQED